MTFPTIKAKPECRFKKVWQLKCQNLVDVTSVCEQESNLEYLECNVFSLTFHRVLGVLQFQVLSLVAGLSELF